MELECAKYHEKMDSEQAVCRHPDDYCRHRTSCMIYFLEQENSRNGTDRMARNEKNEQVKE
jgi:hypothetical protein